ncbi:MAG: hypothetical protein H0W45_10990 [Acidobacteria bacterium]|nr:hypothetical protein [Acidobacteriota bacterium]
MRSKTILSTAAFIVAFAASAAFANLFITKTQTVSNYALDNGYKSTSCFTHRNNSTTADKISALIREDKNNESVSGRKSYLGTEDEPPPFTSSLFPDYAVAVKRYAGDSNSIKASDLPNDFQVEWRAHMKAWRDYSEFLNRMKKPSIRAALSNEEIKEVDDFHTRIINGTWEAVLRTGASYGADVY